MQQRIEAITAYTVPSTFVSSSVSLNSPYRRVVGLKIRCFDEMWSRVDPLIPQAAYSRIDSEAEKLLMPEGVCNKLGRYYSRFFIEPPREKIGNHPEDRRTEAYNCHRFGYWMRGTLVAYDFELPEEPNHIVDMGREGYPLPVGVHGVVGIRDDLLNHGSALHSVVGLGTDNDECIQVLADHGFMGIDTYANVLSFYQSQPSTGDYVAKVYY